jgi:hypothetical protein
MGIPKFQTKNILRLRNFSTFRYSNKKKMPMDCIILSPLSINRIRRLMNSIRRERQGQGESMHCSYVDMISNAEMILRSQGNEISGWEDSARTCLSAGLHIKPKLFDKY